MKYVIFLLFLKFMCVVSRDLMSDALVVFRILEKDGKRVSDMSWSYGTTSMAKDHVGTYDCVPYPNDIPPPDADMKWDDGFYSKYVEWLKGTDAIVLGERNGYSSMQMWLTDKKEPFFCSYKDSIDCVTTRSMFMMQCMIKQFL